LKFWFYYLQLTDLEVENSKLQNVVEQQNAILSVGEDEKRRLKEEV